jgi:hypothetical protein
MACETGEFVAQGVFFLMEPVQECALSLNIVGEKYNP